MGRAARGIYVTPINWHLNPAEAAYIVNDCGASLLFGSADLLGTLDDVELSPSGASPWAARCPVCDDYETLLADSSADADRRPERGQLHVLLVGHDGPAEGDHAAADRRRDRRPNSFSGLMSVMFGVHRGLGVPLAVAALPRRPGGLDDRRAPPGRHRGRDGALRPDRAPGS